MGLANEEDIARITHEINTVFGSITPEALGFLKAGEISALRLIYDTVSTSFQQGSSEFLEMYHPILVAVGAIDENTYLLKQNKKINEEIHIGVRRFTAEAKAGLERACQVFCGTDPETKGWIRQWFKNDSYLARMI